MPDWPDPQRPGMPADPSRPWHWVTRREGGAAPLPVGWNGAMGHWMVWDGTNVGPEEAARRFAYLGPCLTPAEAEAALAKARRDAEAATRPPAEPRGLAALAASAIPDPPPAMVFRKDAIRNHLLIFAGTLFGTLFLIDKFNLMR